MTVRRADKIGRGYRCPVERGLGDTIRVSLSEIGSGAARGRKLIDYVSSRAGHAPIKEGLFQLFTLLDRSTGDGGRFEYWG